MTESKRDISVLVTGATGTVGPTLVQHLLENGYQVRVLVRPTSNLKELPAEVIPFVGDINDAEVVKSAVAGTEIVFHLAAKLHVINPDETSEAEFEKVNVEGTKTIVNAAASADVRRLVFFSTINVYGRASDGEVFDESSPVKPDSSYAVTKAKAEQIVLNALRGNDNKPFGTILRSAAVYGPRMKGNYARLVKGINQGWFVPIGKCSNRRTLIFHEDLAEIASLAANHPDAVSQVYNLSDGSYYTLKEIIDVIYTSFDKKPVKYHIPVLPMKIAAYLLEVLFTLMGKNPFITPKTIDNMLEDRAVSGTKIQEELGFKPRTDLQQGWELAIEGLIDDMN